VHYDPAEATRLLCGMFPNLAADDVRIASRVDASQNCLAFVIGTRAAVVAGPWTPKDMGRLAFGAPNYWPAGPAIR